MQNNYTIMYYNYLGRDAYTDDDVDGDDIHDDDNDDENVKNIDENECDLLNMT